MSKKIKNVLNTILDTLAGSIGPLIPLMLGASMFKMLVAVLGPDMLKTVFIPFLSVLIMLPVMLCVCGPIGGFIGNGLSAFLLGLDDVPVIGFLAVALIAGLWQLIVMVGMHQVFVASMVIVFSSNGMESVVSPAAAISSIAAAGMLLGAFLRIKEKKEKSLTLSYLIASFIGGITEPGIYGTALKFKRPFIGLLAGGFIGGLYASITGVASYALVPVASFFAVTGFVGGPEGNFLNGIIASVIGFVRTKFF